MGRADQNRKWKFKDLWGWIVNAFMAVMRGEFLLRAKVTRYFMHIVYTFLLFWVSIYLSLKIEKTLTKVEANRKELQNVEIYHAQKTVELERLGRMSTIQQMLKDKESAVGLPLKPAETIE